MSEKPEEIARMIAHHYVHCYASEHAGQPHSSDCADLTRSIATAIKEAEARAYERAAKVAEEYHALVHVTALGTLVVPHASDAIRALITPSGRNPMEE